VLAAYPLYPHDAVADAKLMDDGEDSVYDAREVSIISSYAHGLSQLQGTLGGTV
jgi:hypothetical protein